MNKKEIINKITINYNEFIEYIKQLSQADYNLRYNGKWSAGEQLAHIVMCVKPLVHVYGLPKDILEQNFGKVDRQNKSYQAHVDDYLEKLNAGGKAPTQYIPVKEKEVQRDLLLESLKNKIETLNSKINQFEEAELESLAIPHPLLGKITLKEMLYNAIYHVHHHKIQAMNNIQMINV